MRFLELNFEAWGPFTTRRLDLSPGQHGLHVLFGPNEAGKSSALRGLRALLFGIPGQTGDNFVHPHTALRIGARLRAKNGQEIAFVRRKGNRNTLLADDGQTPLADDALRPFLGPITADLFAAHFAMSHADLVSGGDDILAGKGDVGQSLFAAAVGTSRLRDVIGRLDGEAEELFVGRAHNRKINHALRELDERRRAVRDTALSVEDWRRQQDALDAAMRERELVTTRLAKARLEGARLERLQDLLPMVDELRVQRQRRAALGEVVLLPPDFAQQAAAARDQRERAGKDRAEADQEIADREAELENLVVDQAVLKVAGEIDTLHEDLGSHRKASKDRPGILQRKLLAERDAQRLLKDIDGKLELADVDRLRPALALRARIESLAKESAKYEAEIKAARERLDEVEEALKKSEEERADLQPSRDPSLLAAAIEAALGEGKASDLAALRRKEQEIVQTAQREIDRTGIWQGTPEAAEGLALPVEETLNRFEVSFADLERSGIAYATERTRCEKEASEAEQKLAELAHAGAVPSEDDLAANRTRREQIWKLVRRAWLAGEDVTEAARQLVFEEPLQDAYEAAVSGADSIADRLRREADRVASRASAAARKEKALREGAQNLAAETERNAKQTELLADWRKAWAPANIDPATPKEMRAFAATISRVRERAKELRQVRLQISEHEQRVASLRAAITSALADLGEADSPDGFAPLLARARKVLADVEENERKRQNLAKGVSEAQRRRSSAQRTLDAATAVQAKWGRDLHEATLALPLGPNAGADAAIAVLRQLDEVVRKLEEARGLEVRLNAIDKDAERFQAGAAALAARVASDLKGRNGEEIAEVLHKRCDEAGKQAVARPQVEQRRQDAARRRDKATREAKATEAKLRALGEQAHCAETELDQAAERSKARRQIDERIEQIEGGLARLGLTADQAETQDTSINREQLPIEIERLGTQIQEDERHQHDLIEKIGATNVLLGKMNGEAQAARAAEEEQAVLARIRQETERYLELRLAARILRYEIERYRKAHQAPLLESAGGIFEQLTKGSFARLEADFDEKDAPVLVGVRPTGNRVHVEGMSDGTRDQLHLALRLAHVRQQLGVGEPLPLVLDDLLIHFDDARSGAALSVLAELSDQTQVLLFTHHARVRDLARERGGERTFVHEIANA